MLTEALRSDIKNDRHLELHADADRRNSLFRPRLVARAFARCRAATLHTLPTPSDQPSPDVARVA
jgi:hypothetical protein